MALRRAWYRAAEYKKTFAIRSMGDGSTIECQDATTVNDPAGLERFRLTRVYPWGFRQVILFHVLPNGETKYDEIGDGPERPQRRPEDDMGHPEYRTPLFRGAVPGQGVTNTRDEATRKEYATSAEFEREYENLKLAKTMTSDHSTMHRGSAPVYNGSAGHIEAFDPAAGVPPLPRRG